MFALFLLAATASMGECDLSVPYPKEAVLPVLKIFHIPEREWRGLFDLLDSSDGRIEKLYQEKVAALSKNVEVKPLQLSKIKKEATRDVFIAILKESEVVDDPGTSSEMFDEIERQKAKIQWNCLQDDTKSKK